MSVYVLHQLISQEPPDRTISLAMMFLKGALGNYRHFQGVMSLVFRIISNGAKMPCVQHSPVVENCLIRRFYVAKASRLKFVPSDGQQQDYSFISDKAAYVLDPELADQIATAVRENQADPSVPVLESNPGIGLVTQRLLQAGVSRVLAIEGVQEFLPYMQMLQKEVGSDALTIFHWEFTSVWMGRLDPDCNYRRNEDSVIALIPCRGHSDGPPLSVITVLPESKESLFLAYLIKSFSEQSCFFTLGHPEWFLVISPLMYKKILASKKEKERHVLLSSSVADVLELLFDIHLCAELPAQKFTAKFPKKKGNHSKLIPDVSNNKRYLVRLTTRKNVNDILLPSEVDFFYGFVQQVLMRKKQRLIIRMEQLVPNCGIRLIAAGYTMTEWALEPNPWKLLHIFKEMRTWPEYNGSPMKQHLTDRNYGLLDEDASHEH